jgi:hypothetical protein
MEPPQRNKDIYGRRPTSTSRGKTHERVMALQHAAGTIPGTEGVLEERPAGSIAEGIMGFHATWVETKPVTTRRAYERSLAFFARDLAESGPVPAMPVAQLDRDRLVAHLDWRVAAGLTDVGELQRAGLHLARLAEWLDEMYGTSLDAPREWMRDQAAARIAAAPPAYHTATAAAELRETADDAVRLGATDEDAPQR